MTFRIEVPSLALERSGRIAIVRCAILTDLLGLARLQERAFFSEVPASASERRRRSQRIRSVWIQLQKKNSIFIVVETEGTICAANYFRFGRNHEVFSSNGAINSLGRDFDSRLIIRIAEHFVNCCKNSEWPAVKFYANFNNPKAAQVFSAYFCRNKIKANAVRMKISFFNRLIYGSYKDLILLRF